MDFTKYIGINLADIYKARKPKQLTLKKVKIKNSLAKAQAAQVSMVDNLMANTNLNVETNGLTLKVNENLAKIKSK